MEERKRFAVVGSDARQAAAGWALARAGYAVGGAEQVALADYILLPLPLDAARTPLAELLRAAKPVHHRIKSRHPACQPCQGDCLQAKAFRHGPLGRAPCRHGHRAAQRRQTHRQRPPHV